MAKITVSEISANYGYNIGTNSYATVALPITSCWGPGYFDPKAEYSTLSESEAVEAMLEKTVWRRYPATQVGLDSFVSDYRGPSSIYRAANDYSYQMALTLLTAGYDVLTCRICPGTNSEGVMVQYSSTVATGISGYDDYYANGYVKFKAKYPGTFGNNIQISVQKMKYVDPNTRETVYYWNIVTYVVDASGVRSSVENKSLVFNIDKATDSVPYYKDVESNFWTIKDVKGTIVETESAKGFVWYDSAISLPNPLGDGKKASDYYGNYVRLGIYNETKVMKYVLTDTSTVLTAAVPAGTDYNDNILASLIAADNDTDTDSDTDTEVDPDVAKALKFEEIIKPRFEWAKNYQLSSSEYSYPIFVSEGALTKLGLELQKKSETVKNILYYQEWLRTHLVGLNLLASDGSTNLGGLFDLLKDKLSYNPNRVISPGWDDQDYTMYTDDQATINQYYGQNTDTSTCKFLPSPLHLKLMDVAYYSRCATGFIDVPKSIERKYVHIENPNNLNALGYIQELARVVPKDSMLETNASLFTTHCGFFAPWGQYPYVGSNKMTETSPSFLTLMIQRAQILNQATQYEWALPTNRKHNLKIGKMQYTVPKKVLDQWQKLEGASVNVITNIPDLGTNVWGNSTMYEVPPATYQALANLSTRFLVNAIEDLVYRCGIAITFQYNNNQSYSAFYAGVSPLLDTMRNVGAIEGYRIEMSADINGEDYVNSNTIIGKIWILVAGVVNDIYVDLVALPAGAGIDLATL